MDTAGQDGGAEGVAAPSSRREFFVHGAQAVAAGMALAVASLGAEKRAFAQRPPGALAEKAFISRCVKCGQCGRACPYNAILMAEPGCGVAPGTPYIVARKTPCYMCPDIPCVPPCPSGALDPALKDVSRARMGLAALTGRETCIALQGLRCEVCYTACPVMDKAITLEARVNQRTERHAIFEPVVHSDACTGCGKCEHACILDKPAIIVMSAAQAKGELGAHYRLGWKEEAAP